MSRGQSDLEGSPAAAGHQPGRLPEIFSRFSVPRGEQFVVFRGKPPGQTPSTAFLFVIYELLAPCAPYRRGWVWLFLTHLILFEVFWVCGQRA